MVQTSKGRNLIEKSTEESHLSSAKSGGIPINIISDGQEARPHQDLPSLKQLFRDISSSWIQF